MIGGGGRNLTVVLSPGMVVWERVSVAAAEGGDEDDGGCNVEGPAEGTKVSLDLSPGKEEQDTEDAEVMRSGIGDVGKEVFAIELVRCGTV